MRKTHWLDQIAQELWQEIHADEQHQKEALRGDVPLGTVSSTPEEQLSDYLSKTPEDLEALRQTVGDQEFGEYKAAMTKLMGEKLGPFASLFEVFDGS